MFQIGFLEVVLILIMSLFIVGPARMPAALKFIFKTYKTVQKQIINLKNDLEDDIGAEEIKKDVFNEMRMEELNLFDKSDKDE